MKSKKTLAESIRNWENRKLKAKTTKFYLTENGSLLPNKFACWKTPFNNVNEKDL